MRRTIRDNLAKLLATFFYIGDMPAAPGTLASLAGVLLYAAFDQRWVEYAILTVAVTCAGWMVSGRAERMIGRKDPSCIVIDEVAGALIAFFMLPLTPAVLVTAFFLFRAFDMFKIYPANKFEDIHGSVGIMTDDLFAGLYTNLTMQLAIRLSGIIQQI